MNAAVEPFVKEAWGWEHEVVLIRQGKRGGIYRPSLTLFTYLKLRRGSDIDIADIRSAVKHCPEGFSDKRFKAWADAAIQARLRRRAARLTTRAPAR